MARTLQQRAPFVAAGALRHSKTLQQKTKAPYKVVFEQFTEKKKKLIKAISFSQAAPAGYTFIPAGDPQITNRCKDLAREDGAKVFIVTAQHRPKRRGHISTHISREVHRIGYHFPSLVVEKACMSLGVSLSQSGHVLLHNGRSPMTNLGQRTIARRKGRNVDGTRDNSFKTDLSQATLEIQARETIKDLFPKIPDKDLHAIIRQAFQKGTDRVGNAVELPLSRRVQLAVVAHIRHVYTNYDRLLRVVSYQEARQQIEKPCLDLLAEWRSDDDDPDAMEDILREVIVIDDDDDDDDDLETSLRSTRSDSDSGVEIISRHAFAAKVQTQNVDLGTSGDMLHQPPQRSPKFDGRDSALNAREQPQPYTQQFSEDLPRVDRHGVYHHRWQEALHRRRMNQGPTLTLHTEPVMQDPIDYGRYLQLQNDARSQMLPLNRNRSIVNQEIGVTNRGPKESFADLGQVVVLAQQHSNPIDSRQVKYMVSNREREDHHDYSEYNHRFNTQIVPLGESRRPTGGRSPDRPFQEYPHDPRLHFVPRQAERIIPSVEDSFRNINHQKDVSNDINEETHKFEQLDISARRGAHKPRIINLDNKTEVHANESHRLHERVPLPSDKFWQSPRDSHEQITPQVFRKPNDEGPGSYQEHAPLAHQSVSDSSAGANYSTVFRPTDTRDYRDWLKSVQISPNPIDGVSQIAQRGFDQHAHPTYNMPSGLVRQRQVLLKPANAAVEQSQSFPVYHYSQKQLPIVHGSSRSRGKQDGAELRYEAVNPGRVDAFRSNAPRVGENSQGMQYRFADLSFAPDYHRGFAGDHLSEFDGSRTAYASPQIDETGFRASERPRTGILLRKIDNDRHSKPDGGPRPSEPVLHLSHEYKSRSQFHDSGAVYKISNERQNWFQVADKRRDNIGRVEDEAGQELASYDQSENAKPFRRTEWDTGKRDLQASADMDRGRRLPEEIIVID